MNIGYMLKANKLHHCICILAIIIFVWSYHAKPGRYRESLNGRAMISSTDTSVSFCYGYLVFFQSETKPHWEWSEPNNVFYDHIDLTIDVKTEATVLFPSLTCKYGNKQAPFTKHLLKDLLTANSKFDTITPQQLNELFNFIMSAGKGTLPRPRHHPYHIECPYDAYFTHFRVGGDSVPLLGVPLLAAGILLRLLTSSSQKRATSLPGKQKSRRQLSLMLVVVLINYGIFWWGVFLDNFGGPIDKFGAFLFENSCIFGTLLIPVSILYSLLRRFATRVRKWDFYGPYTAILFYLIITLFFRIQPWFKILHLLRNT
jgi:hypothetical protein